MTKTKDKLDEILEKLVIPEAIVKPVSKKDKDKAEFMSVVLNYQARPLFYKELQSVKEAKQAIEAYIKEREDKARIDEIKRISASG